MASVTNLIESSAVVLSISTDTVTPAYSSVVCAINKGLEGSADVNTQSTDCGVAKARGTTSWSVTGTFAANTSPGGTEMSADDLIALMVSGDSFLFKLAHSSDPTKYYRQGTAFFSSYSEGIEQNGFVTGDFTMDVIGDPDYTSA